MDNTERRLFLIDRLLSEDAEAFAGVAVPDDEEGQRRLLRALLNVRPPRPAGGDLLAVQDAYLQEELRHRGVVETNDLPEAEPGIALWQGDITRLACDAIVNAANSQLLGCFAPCHGCIDNAIHTYAGIQLRLECAALKAREHIGEERTGGARITPGFNLPARFVLHTVGPVVGCRVTDEDRALLASCYRSCLELAEQNGLESVAFCCISTGEFRFPHEEAAEIALRSVREFLKVHAGMKVIFNVFKELDRKIYARLLGL